MRHQNQRSYLDLKIRIRERDWNEAQSLVRKSHEQHMEVNRYLSERLTEAQRMLEQAITTREGIRVDEIIGRLRAAQEAEMNPGTSGRLPEDQDFLAYYRKRLGHYEKRSQWSTFEAYRVAYNKLATFVEDRWGRDQLAFTDLTVDFLEDFRTELIHRYDNSVNTVHKNMTSIRTILYSAIREDLFPQEKNPFFRIRLQKKKGTRHHPISIETIWQLEDLDLPEHLNDARNAFLFAFYEGGVRISDVIQMRSENIVHDGQIWTVSYSAQKTKKESEVMPLWPPSEKILRQYGWPDIKPNRRIFPYIPSKLKPGGREEFDARKRKTSLVNKHLRTLQRMIGLESPLTTHVARHSFGHLLDEAGWEIQAIQRLLRHSDTQTTQIYIESMRSRRYDDRLQDVLRIGQNR